MRVGYVYQLMTIFAVCAIFFLALSVVCFTACLGLFTYDTFQDYLQPSDFATSYRQFNLTMALLGASAFFGLLTVGFIALLKLTS